MDGRYELSRGLIGNPLERIGTPFVTASGDNRIAYEGALTFRGFYGYYEVSAGERRSGFTVGKQANGQIRVSL